MTVQKFRVLDYVRRVDDDRLFGPGEIAELDTATVNVAGLIARGAIAPFNEAPEAKEAKGK